MVADTAFPAADWRDFPISLLGDSPGIPGNLLGDRPCRRFQPLRVAIPGSLA